MSTVVCWFQRTLKQPEREQTDTQTDRHTHKTTTVTLAHARRGLTTHHTNIRHSHGHMCLHTFTHQTIREKLTSAKYKILILLRALPLHAHTRAHARAHTHTHRARLYMYSTTYICCVSMTVKSLNCQNPKHQIFHACTHTTHTVIHKTIHRHTHRHTDRFH